MGLASRIVAIVLLSLTILLGAGGLFLSTGEGWTEQGGVRTTETYSILGVETDVGGSTTSHIWGDGSEDGTGGISFLRIAPMVVASGVVFAIVALILIAVPRTAGTVSSGFLGLAAFFLILIGVLVHLAGMTLRATAVLGAPDAVTVGAGFGLEVLALLLAFAGGIIGLLQRTPAAAEPEDEEAWDDEVAEDATDAFEKPAYASPDDAVYEPAEPTHDSQDSFDFGAEEEAYPEAAPEEPAYVETHRLRCPSCSVISEFPIGATPVCSACGYGA